MSKTTALAAVKKSLDNFKLNLVAALAKTPARASHADDADTLQNFTPAQVIAQLRAQVSNHTNKLGQGVHQTDPHLLGSYNKAEFDAKFDLMLDNDSGLPLSFYGDREYLPPGITGSFESGSQYTPWGQAALMLEDNGTLVFLRSGTDGDSFGVFYAYLRNAQAETDLTKVVMTNTKYQPAYIPANLRPLTIISSTQDIIIGALVNMNTGARAGYFVSITNNTLDQTKHTGFVVPEGDIFSVNPTGAEFIMYSVPFAYIKNGYAYFLVDLDRDKKVGFRVYRCTVAQLNSGTYGGMERVTGWTINRGNAGVVTSDDLVLFDNFDNCIVHAGDPFTTVSPVSSSSARFAMVREDGRVLIYKVVYLQCLPSDNGGTITDRNLHYVFELPDSKVVDMSTYYNAKAVITYSNKAFVYTPNPAYPGDNTYRDYVGNQVVSSFYTTKFNQMWVYTSGTYYSSRFLLRMTHAGSPDPKDLLAGNLKVQTAVQANVIGRYGSGLSDRFRGHGNVGDDVAYLYNLNRAIVNGVSVDQNFLVRCALVGSPTYQYGSITGKYKFLGFAPTTDRTYPVQSGKVNDIGWCTLNESDANNSRLSGARFTPTVLSRAAVINRDFSTVGQVSVTPDVMGSLLTQVRQDLSNRGIALYNSGGSANLLLELVIPQIYTDMPAFISGVYVSAADQGAYHFVYSVNTTGGTRQALTAAVIVPSSFVNSLCPVTKGQTLYVQQDITACGQTAIRRCNGGFAVGIVTSQQIRTIGDFESFASLLTYDGTWTFKGNAQWNYYTLAPAGWLNFPSRGLHLSLCSESLYGFIDAATKLMAIPVAVGSLPTDTLQAFVTNLQNADAGKGIFIVASQKTPSNWTIYFSDEVPVMLDGAYTTLPPSTYDLDPTTSANKRFYVWVVKRAGVISHEVVAGSTTAPVADAGLYLGYVTTNDVGISSIVCEKKTAVGGMVLARTSQGTAIPLTSGTPNSAGRLNWK